VTVAGIDDVAAVDVESGFSDGVAQAVGPLVPDVIVRLPWHASVEEPDVAMTQGE
jgi:hypothetical protein